MKCYQCSNLPMYTVGKDNISLCLDCFFKFSQIQQQQTENNERMLNYLQDEMSAAVGLAPIGARFPIRQKPTFISGVKMHNISVHNSVVGTINTGTIGTVDQSISALVQIGEPKIAESIKALSEAIIQSNDLTVNQKNELINAMSVIAKEAATPIENRNKSVALDFLEKAKKITDVATDISELCQKIWPIIVSFFSN